MEGIYLLIGLIALHFMLFFFDLIFKSCSHLPYLLFLQNTGLEVSFLRLRWFTTGLNRSFQRWGRWRPDFQAIWFSVGVVCSLGLMPVACFLVLRGLFASTSAEGTTKEPSGFELEPVVPGVNLPLNQLGNYMMALAVSGLLHEMGHALAAAREGVSVLGCGAQLLLMLPIASVDLSTQRLSALPTWRRLRVLCAGVWHNVVLALLALLILHALAYTPVYTLGKGVCVTSVVQGSGISGPAGVKSGDHVIAVDQCQVTDTLSWQRCLHRVARSPQSSYCLSNTWLSQHRAIKEGDTCCGQESARHLCFYNNNKTRWCLPARDVIEVSSQRSPCPDVTLTPDLEFNSTRLLVIRRENLQRSAVLFLGPPLELRTAVQVSDWLPVFEGLPPWLPEMLSYACSYIAALSSGLALLNLLPCYGFDGQHIINLLVEVLLSCFGVRAKSVSSTVGAGFTAVGTGCLLAWLTLAMYKILPAS